MLDRDKSDPKLWDVIIAAINIAIDEGGGKSGYSEQDFVDAAKQLELHIYDDNGDCKLCGR